MAWFWLLLMNRVYQSPFLLSIYKICKGVLRLTTRTTEIYRICCATAEQLGWQEDLELEFLSDEGREDYPLIEASLPDAETAAAALPEHVVFRIDRSILYSKYLELERRELESVSCNLDEVVENIMAKKQFPPTGVRRGAAACVLRACLARIAETYQLTHEINERAHTKYDSNNPLHEHKLIKLWESLMPDIELESRLTRQWGEIGFQGNDPATDFRGMGLQGLDDLVYYASTHPESAQKTFTSSRHPVSWYPFAIVGINITQYAVQALRTRQLQYYLFKYGASKKAFNEFYCLLYHRFNDFWTSHDQPQLTVMDFEAKFKEFKVQINKELSMHQIMSLADYLEWRRAEEEREADERMMIKRNQEKQHVD